MGNFNWRYTNSVKQTYKGRSYRSKAEAKYAFELDLRLKNKEFKSWEYEKKIELFGENGTRICNYKIDFVIHHHDGVTEFVEVKGYQTAIWRLKWKLFNDKYGKDSKYKITLERT